MTGAKSEGSTQSKQSSLPSFKRILVAVDGSDHSMRAARVAVDLAQKYASELVVLHVTPMASYSNLSVLYGVSIPPPPAADEKYREYQRNVAKTLVNRAAQLAEGTGVSASTAIQESPGSVVERIAAYAQGEKIDLIVIGSRGLSGLKKLVMGSVSGGVITHAHCPVLVVR